MYSIDRFHIYIYMYIHTIYIYTYFSDSTNKGHNVTQRWDTTCGSRSIEPMVPFLIGMAKPSNGNTRGLGTSFPKAPS